MVKSILVSYDYINEILLVGERQITRTKAINMKKNHEALELWLKLVPFDFDHSDIEVVIVCLSKNIDDFSDYILVGRKESKTTKVINVIQGVESLDIWKELIGA